MPLIDFDFLERAAPDWLSQVEIGIETGTCFGASTRIMAGRLKQVVTIELDRSLHERTSKKMKAQGYAHVSFLLGDSGRLLPELLRELPESPAPLLVFLDAHWSGDSSVNWEGPSVAEFKGFGADTAHRGERCARPGPADQNPLFEELDALLSGRAGPMLLLIDDLQLLPESGPGRRDWGFPGEDWSHLSLASLLKRIGPRLLRMESCLSGPPGKETEQGLFWIGPR